LERYGLANLMIATAMSGVMLLAMGLLRLGTLIRFIPVAVVIGFTNGIAVLIMVSQLKDFFGLQVKAMPADFLASCTRSAPALALTTARRWAWPSCAWLCSRFGNWFCPAWAL